MLDYRQVTLKSTGQMCCDCCCASVDIFCGASRLWFCRLSLQRFEQGAPVEFVAGQRNDIGFKSIQIDGIEHPGATHNTGGGEIDQQFPEGQQRRTVRLHQMQVTERQAKFERIEFGPLHAETMACFFGDELLGLRLQHARQQQPCAQQTDKR